MITEPLLIIPIGLSVIAIFPLRIESGSGENKAKGNREAVILLIGEGKLRGYLAYMGDQAIGWCKAAPKVLIPELEDLRPEDADWVGSINAL